MSANFGRITQAPCINEPPPPDERCSDPAFALANPDKCPVPPTLVIRPSLAFVCDLASVQYRASYIVNGVETDVTDQTIFQSSNNSIAIVGAASGNATGLSTGTATITGAYQDKVAFAELTVLGDDCCEERSVALMVVLDKTRSMSQSFGGAYTTKLAFAKAAATRFITEVNENKDVVGLMTFSALDNPVLAEPTADKDAVAALVPGIAQTQQLTTFFNALKEAVYQLDQVTADVKVILLISDGEDTDTSYADEENPIALLSNFKSTGGIVMALGVRAHGYGYALMSTFATGGFFLNGYSAVADATLDYLSGLKGYVCAGNCVPPGDVLQASGALNFCSLINWDVTDGHVDLLGNGFLDLLPGNGLYLDLAGATAPHKGRLHSKDSFAIESGKEYSLTLKLAGNQRVNAAPNTVRAQVFARNTDGIPEQALSDTPTLSEGAGAADVESYEYAFSYLNANGETLLTPSSASITNGGFATFNITLTPDAAVGGTASLVRFWKREVGTTRWALVAEGDPASDFVDTYNNARLAAALTAGTIDACAQPVSVNTTGTLLRILDQVITINSFQEDFTDHIFTFSAPYDASVWISIQQLDSAAPAVGLLLDGVTFRNVTDGEVLLADDFNDENIIYIPPACGLGTYGSASTSTPVESLGPNLAADATTGPGNDVDAGQGLSEDWWLAWDGNVDENTWIATCTAGACDAGSWTRYKFPDGPETVTQYSIGSHMVPFQSAPSGWVLAGSNDEFAWDDIDTQANVLGWDDLVSKTFTVATPGSYQFYRFTFTTVVDVTATSFSVADIQLFSGGQTTSGYATGYHCYGEGCLTEPPAVQAPDPTFGDGDFLENGFTPPKEFEATTTVCVPCPQADYVNLGPNLVPVMTSDTLPSGVASASSASADAWRAFDGDQTSYWTSDSGFAQWLRFQLTSAKTVRAYGVQCYRAANAPTDWIFQGSNDGTTWTALHTVTGVTWADFLIKRWLVSSPASYAYYRLFITSGPAAFVIVNRFELFEMPGNPCATASGVGSSPALALAAATAAATALASAKLNCVQSWTRTVSKTKHCESCGPDVTRPGTAISLNSEQEAIDAATAIALAAAEDDLNCEQSVNDQPVQFNNGTLAQASPYPSYKFVEGEGVSIDAGGLTITLLNLKHYLPEDMVLVLRAPDGTAVMILNHSGNGLRFIDGVDITFDDAAGSPLPVDSGTGAIPAGSYQPYVEGGFETTQLPAPAPTQPYATALSAFDGKDANGCWQLFAVHRSFYTVFDPTKAKIIDGWELNITAS